VINRDLSVPRDACDSCDRSVLSRDSHHVSTLPNSLFARRVSRLRHGGGAVRRACERVRAQRARACVCVPTTFSARQPEKGNNTSFISFHGVPPASHCECGRTERAALLPYSFVAIRNQPINPTQRTVLHYKAQTSYSLASNVCINVCCCRTSRWCVASVTHRCMLTEPHARIKSSFAFPGNSKLKDVFVCLFVFLLVEN
jgi:hypothetical protein